MAAVELSVEHVGQLLGRQRSRRAGRTARRPRRRAGRRSPAAVLARAPPGRRATAFRSSRNKRYNRLSHRNGRIMSIIEAVADLTPHSRFLTCAQSYQDHSPIIARDEAVTSSSLTRVYPSSCAGLGAASSRTSTATASSTSTLASPSSPPVSHPAVNAAIHAQVDDVLHYCSSDFYLPAYADVCERLARWRRWTIRRSSSPTPAPRRSRLRSSSLAITQGGRT